MLGHRVRNCMRYFTDFNTTEQVDYERLPMQRQQSGFVTTDTEVLFGLKETLIFNKHHSHKDRVYFALWMKSRLVLLRLCWVFGASSRGVCMTCSLTHRAPAALRTLSNCEPRLRCTWGWRQLCYPETEVKIWGAAVFCRLKRDGGKYVWPRWCWSALRQHTW